VKTPPEQVGEMALVREAEIGGDAGSRAVAVEQPGQRMPQPNPLVVTVDAGAVTCLNTRHA
jgi:hypothetical protein